MSAADDPVFALDRRAVARSFDRASSTYDAAAALQELVRTELLERLHFLRCEPQRIVDLGCGTGVAALQLARSYPLAEVLALDIAPGMLASATASARAALNAAPLRRAAHQLPAGVLARLPRRLRALLARPLLLLCADATRLPLAAASVDLVFSSLMLQWCQDLDRAFAEAQRVLRPGGLLLFSTFGPGTLAELREAWSQADGYNHVNRFIDVHDVGSALGRQGFTEPVLDVDRVSRDCAQVRDLVRELKLIGAHNVTRGRARGLTGRQRWLQMQLAYESQRVNGRLPVTYEVIYGCAWAPRAKRTGALPVKAGVAGVAEVVIDVSQIGRRR